MSELLATYDPSASADEMPMSRVDSKKAVLPPMTFKEKRELGLTIRYAYVSIVSVLDV